MKTVPYRILTSLISILLFVVLFFTDCFYHADMLICDGLYKKLESQSRDIKIITIDDKAEAAYGKFENWSREKMAELTELLSADAETAPAVIAFDIMFIGDADAQTDDRLAKACEQAGNVVCASNMVYKGAIAEDADGELYYNASAIAREERPYAALDEHVEVGFTNVCISRDNVIRYAQLAADYNGEKRYSLAYTAYKSYAEKMGLPVIEPKMSGGQVGFFYSGEPGDIPHVSLVDVLEGKVPASEFDDCLVFVGVYAAGFQDAYYTSVARGELMHGVEVNANIVMALLHNKLAVPVSAVLYVLVVSLWGGLWVYLSSARKLWVMIAEAIVLTGTHLLAGIIFARNGYLLPQIYFIVMMLCVMAYYIVQKYFVERASRRRTLQTLKKYVAPQIVDKLSADGDFELHIGGEKRHVAVLFVDVRGFTTMSEAMNPEEVVDILNQYLSVTTKAVFANEGTLDKFIGDATMAVFNAPFDLEDYVFKAVKTAWDIREGVAALAKVYEEKYHQSVNVGVGVNCGEAVVGNIGSEVRMDYTAIGDTVNTAARLESNAPAGKILISQMVYDEISERITAEYMGELALKGKQAKVAVWEVTGFTGKA